MPLSFIRYNPLSILTLSLMQCNELLIMKGLPMTKLSTTMSYMATMDVIESRIRSYRTDIPVMRRDFNIWFSSITRVRYLF
jgi:hypothetical protein